MYWNLCIYVFVYLCIYVFVYLCIYVFMYLCIYVFMYLCIYVFVFSVKDESWPKTKIIMIWLLNFDFLLANSFKIINLII